MPALTQAPSAEPMLISTLQQRRRREPSAVGRAAMAWTARARSSCQPTPRMHDAEMRVAPCLCPVERTHLCLQPTHLPHDPDVDAVQGRQHARVLQRRQQPQQALLLRQLQRQPRQPGQQQQTASPTPVTPVTPHTINGQHASADAADNNPSLPPTPRTYGGTRVLTHLLLPTAGEGVGGKRMDDMAAQPSPIEPRRLRVLS